MTLELTHQLNDNAVTTWKSPAAGLWVAAHRGEYLGMVERQDGHYVVSDALGTQTGLFEELADAQSALDNGDIGLLSDLRDQAMMKATLIVSGVTGLALAAGVFLIAR